jgi:hypothetical protein
LKCENDEELGKIEKLTLDYFLENSEKRIYTLIENLENINSCDYVIDKENCIRNNILEKNIEIFYQNIKE